MQLKATKKQKKLVALPGEYMTRVYIPNNITNARYSYTLMQERIFNYVMFYLQGYIQQVIKGAAVQQLDMFQTTNDAINITIPMMMIAKPAYYNRVRQAAAELAGVLVMIDRKTPEGKEVVRIRGLFSFVEMPKDDERTNKLQLQISKDVAQMLVSIEQREGIPRNYTSFLFEVTMDAKNKYTPRIYKLISSWKKKGGFYITVDELKELLQVQDKYKNNSGIKERILVPVQAELESKADCWYNVTEEKEGKKVIGYTFKVITPDIQFTLCKVRESIIDILRMHFDLQKEHIEMLKPALDRTDLYDVIQYKILDLSEKIRKNKNITNKPMYVVKSILNETLNS